MKLSRNIKECSRDQKTQENVGNNEGTGGITVLLVIVGKS
jgi:hypothetical protein